MDWLKTTPTRTYFASTACLSCPTHSATYATSTIEYGSTILRRFCSRSVSYNAARCERIVGSWESSVDRGRQRGCSLVRLSPGPLISMFPRDEDRKKKQQRKAERLTILVFPQRPLKISQIPPLVRTRNGTHRLDITHGCVFSGGFDGQEGRYILRLHKGNDN